MSLSIYMKGDYEEYYASKAAENKAKQSQFAGESELTKTIPIPINDNRDEAATQSRSALCIKINERLFEKTKPICERMK